MNHSMNHSQRQSEALSIKEMMKTLEMKLTSIMLVLSGLRGCRQEVGEDLEEALGL